MAATTPMCPAYKLVNGQLQCSWNLSLPQYGLPKVELPTEYAYNTITGKVEMNPTFNTLNNTNPAKIIGDAINSFSKKFTEFMTKTVVPFMIGIVGIIMLVMAIGYVFR